MEKQQEAALVTEDVEHVDHAAEEEHPELKLSSHVRKVKKFGRPSPEIEGLVVVTGLSPLITCSLDIGERGLVSTFAERWHKETSSFQLSVGEDTITLDDVTLLLHLTITGAFHNFEALHVDDVVFLLVELLGVPKRQEMRRYNTTTQNPHWTVAAQAYLLHLQGSTLFANKSVTHMHVVFLDAFHDLTQTGSYMGGAAVLVHLYDNLNDASKSNVWQLFLLSIVLLFLKYVQCWIYEHFPLVAYAIAAGDYDERKPHACHWKSRKAFPVSMYLKRLDRLMSDAMCWIPYGDHHALESFN
ncbi:Protein MAIN-LIKE 1 [Glycine soja]